MTNKLSSWIQALAVIVSLGLGAWVVFSPAVVFAPAPRVILFCMMALCPAVLFADRATNAFKMSLPGFAFTATGSAAVLFGLIVLLNHLAKPDRQVAVYEVFDQNGQKLPLAAAGLEVETDPSGMRPTSFIDGNTLVLIFPEQLATANISLTNPLWGRPYHGTVSYAKNAGGNLNLGLELKQ